MKVAAKFFAALILLYMGMLILFSCNPQNKELPLNTLKEIIWDLSKVEAFQTYYLNRDTSIDADAAGDSNYAKVFLLHRVNAEDFFFTLNKYRNSPEQYKLLLDSVYTFGSRLRENAFADTSTLGNPSRNQ